MEELCGKLQKLRLTTASFASDNELFRDLALHKMREPYSPVLQAFATTLHFYSPRAYDYVRRMLANKLPHSRSVVRWYKNVDGDQGINEQAVQAVKLKADEKAGQGQVLVIGMSMDEMGMRKQITWDSKQKKLNGVAYRFQKCKDGTQQRITAAKSALFFMITALDDTWKIPIAYYLVDSIKATTQRDIVNEILQKLHDVGATVVSLTFDGTRTNICTANALGCDLRPEHPLRTSFPHPSTGAPVFALLDAVHMMKLVRNTLFSQGTLNTPSGPARWKFIELLNELQKKTGLLLAPKLTDKHVNFQNSKMKVILAVQVLSQAVADALRYLMERDGDFEDCQGMIEFVQTFNDLFDICNSMEQHSTGFKKPLCEANFDEFDAAFKNAEDFICQITLDDGTPILSSKNKTGFLGFLVDIKSIRGLFKELCMLPKPTEDNVENARVVADVESGTVNEPDLRMQKDVDNFENTQADTDAEERPEPGTVDEAYLHVEYLEIVENPRIDAVAEQRPILAQIFTYRLSQDNLEMYFGKVRSRNGCNDNPDAVQLKAAVKRLLKNNDISAPETGNCTIFQNSTALSVDLTIPAPEPSPEPVQSSVEVVPIEICTSLCCGPEWDSFIEDDLTNAALKITAAKVQHKMLSSCKCANCNEDQSEARAEAVFGIGQVCQFLFKIFVGEERDVDVESYHGYLTTRALNCVLEHFHTRFRDLWKCVDDHKDALISKIIDHFHDEMFAEYSKRIVPYKETIRPKLTKLIHFAGN
ncbi:hypothetical protein quinque_004587 [Culex quinquefasciatus]